MVVSPRRQVGDVSPGTVHPVKFVVRNRADQCEQRQGTPPRDLRKTGSNNSRWHTPRQAQASLFPFPTIRGDPIVSDGKQVQLGQSKGNRWAKTSNYTEHAIHWHRPNYTQRFRTLAESSWTQVALNHYSRRYRSSGVYWQSKAIDLPCLDWISFSLSP